MLIVDVTPDKLLYRTRLFGHKIDDWVCWGARSETTRQDAPRSTIARGAAPWIPPVRRAEVSRRLLTTDAAAGLEPREEEALDLSLPHVRVERNRVRLT